MKQKIKDKLKIFSWVFYRLFIRHYILKVYKTKIFVRKLSFAPELDLQPQKWFCVEHGLNFSTAEYYNSELSKDFKMGVDYLFFVPQKIAEIETKNTVIFCCTRDVLKNFFSIFEKAERINRLLSAFYLKPVFSTTKIAHLDKETKQEANRMSGEMRDGVSRLINKRNKVPLLAPGGVMSTQLPDGNEILTLHGDQLRKLIKTSSYYNFPSNISCIIMGHYHRMFVTEIDGILVVFNGCFVETHPIHKEILMPSVGGCTLTSQGHRNFRVNVLRFV